MFRNYFKTAVRKIKQQKLLSAINIFGLSLGIACVVLIYFFIKSEVTYDRFHRDSDRIYRVGLAVNFQDLEYWDTTPYPMADAMLHEIPGVEQTARFTQVMQTQVRHDQTPIEARVHLVGPSFLDMFDFPLKAGQAAHALTGPDAAIISESVEQRYFRGKRAVGETISINLGGEEFIDFKIAGVAKAIPENSSIKFDVLLSEQLFERIFGEQALTSWFLKTSTVTFFKTPPEASIAEIEHGMQAFADQHNLTTMLRLAEVEKKFVVQNFEEIHFGKMIKNRFLEPNGDPLYSFILAGIALLVLIIASINFMNLSVGLSGTRTKEVGVRKVFGAQRLHLMKQFWFESVLISFLALMFGLLLAELFMPSFNSLSGKNLTLSASFNVATILTLGGMALLVGLVSGIYPALLLSGFKPVKIFRGTLHIGGGNPLSKAMIVLQFALSIFLITGTIIMSRQMQYVGQLQLGIDTELLLFHDPVKRASDAFVERYKQQAMKLPGVRGVAAVRGSLHGDSPGSMWLVSWQGETIQLPAIKVDYDFLQVMGIDLLAGRNFAKEYQTDLTKAVIVNETFVRKFAVRDPVGAEAPLGGRENPIIVGVVKDFHFQSARKKIEPLILNLRPNSDNDQVFTRISGQNIAETIAGLRQIWNSLAPDNPFTYAFFDERIESQYRAEQNFRRIATYAAYFAILIACLGLFGMTSLSTVRRSKEMGIRKVLGASTASLLRLFNLEFFSLLLAANMISWPIGVYAMNTWLENFAYHIDISWWVFGLAGGLALLIAALTVSTQALRAALANPVDALRCE